jgi:hypothetical protein
MPFKMKCFNYETGFSCNVNVSSLNELAFKRAYKRAIAKENPIGAIGNIRSQERPNQPGLLDGKSFILQSYGADIYSDDAKLLFTFR